MNDAKRQFADRLRAAMEAAGYTAKPSVLEREFNLRWYGKPMTLHGVRRWLLGEAIPGQDKIVALAEWLGISPQVLRYGTEVDRRIEERNIRLEEAIRYHEREVFNAYLSLPQTERRAVREIILALASKGKVTPDDRRDAGGLPASALK